MAARQPKCIAVIGTTGTGKSTLAKSLIENLDSRVVVVTYGDDPEIWRPYQEVDSIEKPIKHQGIKKVTFSKYGKKATFTGLYKNLRNAVLVLDDCRQYIKANTEHTPGLVDLIISHRHLGLDIVFIVHSPLQIPPQARPFIKEAYIGKCTVYIKPSNFEVTNPELFLYTQKLVNAECKKLKRHYAVFGRVKL